MGRHRISLWEKNGSIYGWKMDSQQNGNESEKRVVSGRNSVQRKSGVSSCEDRRINQRRNNTDINQLIEEAGMFQFI